MDFAVTKRRSARQLAGRKTVYYEGDSDDEGVELLSDHGDDGAARLENAPAAPASLRPGMSSRRSTRQLAGHKRSVCYEGDSDEDVQLPSDNSDEDVPALPTVRAAPVDTEPSSPKRRSARQPVGGKRSMYYEGDSDDDAVQPLSDHYSDRVSEVETALPPAPPPQRPRKRIKKTHKPTMRSKKQKSTAGARPKKRWEKGWSRPLGTFPKKKSTKKPVEPIPSDGVKPAWGSLPVEILRDIFIFASQPIHETINGSAGVTWLMKTARKTSLDFAVPALEAYYLSPALHTLTQPHHLLELVQFPPEDTYIKYRYKVKRLEIDVKHLAYSAQGRPPFNLSALVRALPQLQQLEITHPMDEPPYRPLKFQKWYYPPDLFDALDETGIRLRTWRWSRDMLQYNSPEDMYRMMANMHGHRCFEYLDRLVFCGFDFNDSAEPSATQPSPPEEAGANMVPPMNLTNAISRLPNLKDLTFISCDIIMEDFLLRLPKTLERLELTNCLEITADILQTHLATHGSQLRELVLNSNAALSLAFLPCLKTACPKLEVLVMDTTYYSEKTNYNDAYAFYDHLLTADQRPTWPSTMRHLELTSLQKWGADAASTLFKSLIDAAPELPDLRRLTIQAHIDIAWRDRADFRDTWVDKLRATFFHKTPPPLPYLCSMKRYRIWKEEQPLPMKEPHDSEDGTDSTSRRLSHVRITPRKPADDHTVFSESEAEPDEPPRHGIHPRRSARVAESQSAASLSATPAPETPGSGEDENKAPFVQGLCEVVDIRIDNQRPRETQYTEANFIDSEISGDEDWHEGAADLSDDGYAW